jgi:hypothetical protein
VEHFEEALAVDACRTKHLVASLNEGSRQQLICRRRPPAAAAG